jgi:hypothetical protein
MKSALLLSPRVDLFRLVANVLIVHGAEYVEGDGGVVQLTDSQGRLLTVFGDSDTDVWNYRDGPFAGPDGELVDTSSMSACVIECRWQDLFVGIAQYLAGQIPEPTWVLDGNDVIWPSGDVDPARVQS